MNGHREHSSQNKSGLITHWLSEKKNQIPCSVWVNVLVSEYEVNRFSTKWEYEMMSRLPIHQGDRIWFSSLSMCTHMQRMRRPMLSLMKIGLDEEDNINLISKVSLLEIYLKNLSSLSVCADFFSVCYLFSFVIWLFFFLLFCFCFYRKNFIYRSSSRYGLLLRCSLLSEMPCAHYAVGFFFSLTVFFHSCRTLS